jgi:hypothetical protein
MCYYTPGLKEKFAPVNSKGVHVEDFYGPADEDDESTDAQPGSEEKILILQRRASGNKSLFHPRDYNIKPKPGETRLRKVSDGEKRAILSFDQIQEASE